ncbi:MAG TPA: gliding motility-associated ABC transporter ATP-binding subunit GldA, partial [Chitinophaga sp.]
TFAEDPAPGELQGLAGVSLVQRAEGNAWLLFGDDVEAVRKNLLQFALINNRNILSLQSNSQSLETIFREITR